MSDAEQGNADYSAWIDNSPSAPKEKEYNFVAGAKAMLFTGPLNLLLLCTPFAIISYAAGWNDAVTFIFSLLAIAPFAERLGFCTEQLAIHTNDTIGGLLNATFGNATELIVAISALQKGLFRVVQLSLIGSVLSNLLLVLGCSFLFGGLRHKTQKYNPVSGQVNSSMLILSTMAVLFPTMLTSSGEETHRAELQLSRSTSLFLLLVYIAFLFFQLKTHKDIYDELPNTENSQMLSDTTNPLDNEFASSNPSTPSQSAKKMEPLSIEEATNSTNNKDNKEDEEEEEEDILGFRYALVWLAVITIFIAVLSEALAETIQRAANSLNISGVFISTIVLPIVGNAAEHASAIIFAMKNKMDIALGVAIGSSTQIALFVLPLLVVIGWMIDKGLSLNFNDFEAYTLFLSVIVTTFVIKDGTSNWLLGLVLIVGYLIVAAGYLARNDEPLDS